MPSLRLILPILFGTAGPALAQPAIHVAVLEGDTIPGAGTVNLVENVAINNSGDWLVEAFTQTASNSQQAIIRNGTKYARMGEVISSPTGSLVTRTLDSVRMDNLGNTFHNIICYEFGDPTQTEFDVVFYNLQPIVLAGDVALAPEFPAGTLYTDFVEVYGNDASQLLVVAKVDHPSYPTVPGADWTDHYALVRFDLTLDPQTQEVTSWTETALLQQGDPLPPTTATLAEIRYLPHTTTFNDNGAWLIRGEGFFPGDTSALPTTHDWMVIGPSGVLLEEGDPSPIPGRNHQFLDASALDLNDYGDLLIKANLDGSLDDDEVIFVNDEAVVQEARILPDTAPYALTSVTNSNGPADLDDHRNVLWVGGWDNPNSDNNSGLFLDETLLIEEGVTQILGRTVVFLDDGRDAYELSDDGRYAICIGRLDNSPNYPLDVALVIDFGPPLPGDVDGDHDVDASDFARFGPCLAGPDITTLPPGCSAHDFATADADADGDVDLRDAAALQAGFGAQAL